MYDSTLKSNKGGTKMDVVEFIELYLQADDETKEEIEELLSEE